MSKHSDEALAVFDFGKTNAKLLVFGADGAIRGEERTTPLWQERGALRVLDDEALWSWMIAALHRAVAATPVGSIMVTTHGCAFALVGRCRLIAPILDYETVIPEPVSAAFDAVSPPFGETYSPSLPVGFNLGRQIFWYEQIDPAWLRQAEAILCYPQFWNWRLTGRCVSEASFLGCHTHLWSPAKRDFSPLVDKLGWRAKFPALARAGEVLGEFGLAPADGSEARLHVHNGVHDSNASLHFYRSLGYASFSLLSTGTWVIAFNTDCPIEALDPARDMLANVSVDGDPIATARFMGGREFDTISQQARAAIPLGAVERAIAAGQFAVPSFAPGGPFGGRRGRLVGAEAGPVERSAVAVLYVACMAHYVLGLLRSANTIVIDGGLAKNALFLGLVAALRPDQAVLQNLQAEGTASGAAALAFEALGRRPFRDPCVRVAPLGIARLADYYRRWRELAEGQEAGAPAGTATRS